MHTKKVYPPHGEVRNKVKWSNCYLKNLSDKHLINSLSYIQFRRKHIPWFRALGVQFSNEIKFRELHGITVLKSIPFKVVNKKISLFKFLR